MGGTPDDGRCAECGDVLGAGAVTLAAAYVDDDGDELDADLAFCGPEHRDAWVARTRPAAASVGSAGAPWREGPSSSEGTGKVVALIAGVLVLFVAGAWLLGRLLA